MNKPKTLVFFGAHPDDESFGVGAILAQYAASGVKVYYVCSTGGELGTVDQKHLACHASQSGGRSRPLLFRTLEIIEKVRGPKDYFMRAYPRPTRQREKDLFEGII